MAWVSLAWVAWVPQTSVTHEKGSVNCTKSYPNSCSCHVFPPLMRKNWSVKVELVRNVSVHEESKQ